MKVSNSPASGRLLLATILSTTLAACGGGGAALDPAVIANIRQWITDGAER